MSLERELADARTAAAAEQDVLPFMQTLHDTGTMAFRPLPGEMLTILQDSPDYVPLPAGAGPVHMQI